MSVGIRRRMRAGSLGSPFKTPGVYGLRANLIPARGYHSPGALTEETPRVTGRTVRPFSPERTRNVASTGAPQLSSAAGADPIRSAEHSLAGRLGVRRSPNPRTGCA